MTLHAEIETSFNKMGTTVLVYKKFAPWDEIIDSNKGFIKDDVVVFQVRYISGRIYIENKLCAIFYFYQVSLFFFSSGLCPRHCRPTCQSVNVQSGVNFCTIFSLCDALRQTAFTLWVVLRSESEKNIQIFGIVWRVWLQA